VKGYKGFDKDLAELQQALEDFHAAESFYNEATPEQMDRAICRYNAAEARLSWLLRDAKLASGIGVNWDKLEEKWAELAIKRLEEMANEQAQQAAN